ncbi:MAG TPA: hypothetical protein VGS57_21475 [Thermoanaerobaculia bacterium]|jgi:hypothetical protein|nr:hypothetical protein [Thermoanaerobaculia bacterium]
MHDLDRTLNVYEPELEEELGLAGEGPFSAHEERELAAELLSLESEEELDHFLGKLFKKAGGLKGVFSTLGKVLKPIAKTALPIVGKVAGSFFGGPVGGAIGGKLGSLAAKLFETELEGVEPEQLEMEVAQRVVRLCGAAAQATAAAPPGASPLATAKRAVAIAAQQHAPGLLRGRFGARLLSGEAGALGGVRRAVVDGADPSRCRCRCRAGVWVRRGNKVILVGA